LGVNPKALLLLYADKVKLCLTEKREEFQFTFVCMRAEARAVHHYFLNKYDIFLFLYNNVSLNLEK